RDRRRSSGRPTMAAGPKQGPPPLILRFRGAPRGRRRGSGPERIDDLGLADVLRRNGDDLAVLDLAQHRRGQGVVVEMRAALIELERTVEGVDVGLADDLGKLRPVVL